MKKLTLCFLATFLIMTLVSVQLKAGVETHTASMPGLANAKAAEVHGLLVGVYEIKAMDKSRLSSSENKLLRQEVRSAKKRLKEMGGGRSLLMGSDHHPAADSFAVRKRIQPANTILITWLNKSI
jgi:hypothetical protein